MVDLSQMCYNDMWCRQVSDPDNLAFFKSVFGNEGIHVNHSTVFSGCLVYTKHYFVH